MDVYGVCTVIMPLTFFFYLPVGPLSLSLSPLLPPSLPHISSYVTECFVIFLAQVFAFAVTIEHFFAQHITPAAQCSTVEALKCKQYLPTWMEYIKCNSAQSRASLSVLVLRWMYSTWRHLHTHIGLKNTSHYWALIRTPRCTPTPIFFRQTTSPKHFYDSWDSIICITLWSLKVSFGSSEAYFQQHFQSR